MHIPETSKKNTKNLRSGGLRRNGDKKIQADASYLNMSLCLVVYIIRSTVFRVITLKIISPTPPNSFLRDNG